MAGPILFNVAAFRTQFAAFADATAFPDGTLQAYWDTAGKYISQYYTNCLDDLSLAQRTLALNQMTAHIAQLFVLANAGQSGGVVTAATIDKVSVTLEPPPARNEWQWWLNQTPYGAMLLTLLDVASVGGFFVGGFPTTFTLRR